MCVMGSHRAFMFDIMRVLTGASLAEMGSKPACLHNSNVFIRLIMVDIFISEGIIRKSDAANLAQNLIDFSMLNLWSRANFDEILLALIIMSLAFPLHSTRPASVYWLEGGCTHLMYCTYSTSKCVHTPLASDR